MCVCVVQTNIIRQRALSTGTQMKTAGADILIASVPTKHTGSPGSLGTLFEWTILALCKHPGLGQSSPSRTTKSIEIFPTRGRHSALAIPDSTKLPGSPRLGGNESRQNSVFNCMMPNGPGKKTQLGVAIAIARMGQRSGSILSRI